MIQTQENAEKPHFGPNLCPLDPKFRPSKFTFKNLPSSVTRFHDQLSSCTKSEKANDPIFRKLSDGQAD